MRKALTILLIILVLPSLLSGAGNIIATAQGGGGGSPGGLGQFIAYTADTDTSSSHTLSNIS